jgi:hypothetical protein
MGRAGLRLVTFMIFCLLAGMLPALFSQEASAATVSDNFNRADGALAILGL